MAFVFMSPVCQIVRQCNILTFSGCPSLDD